MMGAVMAELYNTCFCCYKSIREGDDLVATDDVTCTTESADNEPAEFESWEYNPYRGVYCRDCWDEVLVHIRKIAKVKQNPYVSNAETYIQIQGEGNNKIAPQESAEQT